MRFESFGSRVEAAFSSWTEAKVFLEESVAVSTESLHVVAGVLIQLLAAALLRKPVSSASPWLVVLAIASVNEFMDLSIEQWPRPAMQFGEGVNDLLVTMLLPTVLLITARKTPRIYGPAPRAADTENSAEAAGPV